jgi:3-oxosteroid 1-dehydrogenase
LETDDQAGWDEFYDFVIAGSGGGSMVAALAARDQGKTTLILEKQNKVGGSTAMSGGVWWIPNNPLMRRAGRRDSYEQARTYMDAVIGPETRGSTRARRDAFLRAGPAMVEFLEKKGMKFHLSRQWPDYYGDRPGGNEIARSLVADLFDLNELGEWQAKLNTYKGFSLPLPSDDIYYLPLAKRTWRGKIAILKVLLLLLREKLTGSRYRGQGASIQGRMLNMTLREGISVRIDTPVLDLISENDRVVGVLARCGGKNLRIRATHGVLINVGGFARNAELRHRWQRQPITNTWTNANDGDTGEIIEVAMRLGAAVENLDLSIWVPSTRYPDGRPAPDTTMPDGTVLNHMHVIDISKPHLIVVNCKGERFANESGSYMEFGERMYQYGPPPCWVIMDCRNRDWYPWGLARPGHIPRHWLETGYFIQADSLEALAERCGIDGDGLRQTVQRFNGFCVTGKDLDFNRGGRAYDRFGGDYTVKPNPNLGSIEKPPFYACAMFPGDVGTYGGLVCDEYSRVLRDDGSVISGLYATGNSTSSVTGRYYIGAGTSIAASFIFGYIAALHASDPTIQREA